MPAATAPKKARKGCQQTFVLDPDELARRLSVVVAEQKYRELEWKRSNWEADLLQARREQADRMPSRAQLAPFEDRHSSHGSVSPAQIPPASDYPSLHNPRKASLPYVGRMQGVTMSRNGVASFFNTSAPRKPSKLKCDSALDLEATNKLERDNKQSRQPDGLHAEDQQEWSPILWRVEEDCSLEQVESEGQYRARSRGRSSILEKLEHVWRFHPNHTNAADTHAFHSDDTTLRNSWISSLRDSIASRKRSSILRRGESCRAVETSPEGEGIGEDGSDTLTVQTPKGPRKSGFFSKLKV